MKNDFIDFLLRSHEIFFPYEQEKRCCGKCHRSIEQVIFENGYTIIVDNEGNRYMSRPEKCEKFDEEKGLLVALAKYDGHTTTEIQELLKGAVRKNAGKAKKSDKKNKV